LGYIRRIEKQNKTCSVHAETSPVAKVSNVDVESQVGHEAEEEGLKIGVDHVAQLAAKDDVDGDDAVTVVAGRLHGHEVVDEELEQAGRGKIGLPLV